MPSTTPKLALPYPLPTEPVAEGAAAIKNLADRLEALGVEWFLDKQGGEQITSTATWTNFATLLEVTVPVAGSYLIHFGGYFDAGGANNGKLGISLVGDTPPTGDPATPSRRVLYWSGANASRVFVASGLAAGNKIKMMGWDDRVASRQGTFSKRFMHVRMLGTLGDGSSSINLMGVDLPDLGATPFQDDEPDE